MVPLGNERLKAVFGYKIYLGWSGCAAPFEPASCPPAHSSMVLSRYKI